MYPRRTEIALATCLKRQSANIGLNIIIAPVRGAVGNRAPSITSERAGSRNLSRRHHR